MPGFKFPALQGVPSQSLPPAAAAFMAAAPLVHLVKQKHFYQVLQAIVPMGRPSRGRTPAWSRRWRRFPARFWGRPPPWRWWRRSPALPWRPSLPNQLSFQRKFFCLHVIFFASFVLILLRHVLFRFVLLRFIRAYLKTLDIHLAPGSPIVNPVYNLPEH